MGYVDCPKCSTRLRLPEVPGPVTLRCPTCKETFSWPGEADASNVGLPSREADDPIEMADEERMDADAPLSEDQRAAIAFDAAETDGEPFSISDVPLNIDDDDLDVADEMPAWNGEGEQPGVRAPAGERSQIAAAMLELVDQLNGSRETSLRRTRALALAGWVLAVAAAIAAGVLGWRGATPDRGGEAAALARVNQLSRTEGQLTDERRRVETMEQRLVAAQNELREQTARAASLEAKIDADSALLAQQRQRSETAVRQADEARTEATRLSAQREELETQLGDVRETLAAREAEIRVLNGELEKVWADAARRDERLQQQLSRRAAATQPAAQVATDAIREDAEAPQ